MTKRWRSWRRRASARIARRLQLSDDVGMSTVEYAIGTVVAAAFAAILYQVVTGDSIVAGLSALISSALAPQW